MGTELPKCVLCGSRAIEDVSGWFTCPKVTCPLGRSAFSRSQWCEINDRPTKGKAVAKAPNRNVPTAPGWYWYRNVTTDAWEGTVEVCSEDCDECGKPRLLICFTGESEEPEECSWATFSDAVTLPPIQNRP